MRILFLSIYLSFSSLTLFAQKGFELTINTSANISFLVNQNDLKETSTQSRGSLGNSSLITVGHNFSKTVGLATGVGFTYLRQNYVTRASAKRLKVLQETSHRALTYIRLPAMLRISSSPNTPVQFFMRFGPHLDILLTATSKKEYAFNAGLADKKINYRNQNDVKEEAQDIFKNFAIGLSLDLGTKIQLNEQFSLLLLAHIESSLTNLEGADAPNYFPANFHPIPPNSYLMLRSHTYGIMMGLNIGLSYKLASSNLFQRSRSRHRTRYWKAQ
ncbi:MAG: hypothetical protein ACI976_001813 [Aureispira sp.]|jgi:hypothetical protein